MNDKLVMFLLDSIVDSSFEWWPFASAALAAFISGALLLWVGRVTRRGAEERRTIQKELSGFGLKIESEREERRSNIETECRIRREREASLGSDISEIREEINYDYGQRGLSRPQWRRRVGND